MNSNHTGCSTFIALCQTNLINKHLKNIYTRLDIVSRSYFKENLAHKDNKNFGTQYNHTEFLGDNHKFSEFENFDNNESTCEK